MEVKEVKRIFELVKGEVSNVVVGADEYVKLMMVSLLARGHVIIEGVPGIAKTLLAKCFSRALSLRFRRIQFTPDMLPSDVLGTYVFNQRSLEFEFRPGPVFANIVLADEVNRAPPKTQSALLEAMQEKQVTINGKTHKLPDPFMVIATQNPIEYEGTYPLPEAQLDRFMMRIIMGYPSPEEELEVLRLSEKWVDETYVKPVVGVEELRDAIVAVRDSIHVDEDVRGYILRIVQESRRDKRVFLGVSPRGGAMLLNAAKAYAALNGRSYVTPDDVKALVFHVFNHRIILRLEYIGGVEDRLQLISTVKEVLREVLERVEPPR